MIYWDEMHDNKYGFSDGNATPPFVNMYRHVYVTALNNWAEHLDSNTRAIAFDRFGLHNSCLTFLVSLDDYNTLVEAAGIDLVHGNGSDWHGGISQDLNNLWESKHTPDEIFDLVLDFARHEAHVDECIAISASVDVDELNYLKGLEPVEQVY
jgi:hypothetical protein